MDVGTQMLLQELEHEKHIIQSEIDDNEQKGKELQKELEICIDSIKELEGNKG